MWRPTLWVVGVVACTHTSLVVPVDAAVAAGARTITSESHAHVGVGTAESDNGHTPPRAGRKDSYHVNLDPSSAVRVFEGHGALSAGASSRLLIDYPEPARGDVLDYLFRPQVSMHAHH